MGRPVAPAPESGGTQSHRSESHFGMSSQKPAELAMQSRKLWRERTGAGPTESCLRELTCPAWYHRIDGPVYSVVGAFADFLRQKFGAERFPPLHFASKPGRFEEEWQAQFWQRCGTLISVMAIRDLHCRKKWARQRITGGLPEKGPSSNRGLEHVNTLCGMAIYGGFLAWQS